MVANIHWDLLLFFDGLFERLFFQRFGFIEVFFQQGKQHRVQHNRQDRPRQHQVLPRLRQQVQGHAQTGQNKGELTDLRERTEEKLRQQARSLVDCSGYNEMSLTSLSSADYSCLGRLVDDLMTDFRDEEVSFSLPSLRIDSFSIDLAHKMQQVRKSGLTFAPEAGTQRLRDVINKGVTEENLMSACGSAFRQGWKQVKLYFMMGLPTETDEDIIGIAKLAKKVVDLYTEIKGRRGVKVTISVACFVPKPYTPFQWFGQLPITEFERRQRLLKEHITDRSITFNYHDARLSVIEGVFARGDRRLAPVLYQAWQDGAKFDGWSDLYQHETWLRSFEKCGVDMAYYNERTRNFNEALPWEITTPGVNKEFLLREWQQAMAGALTEDCRRGKCSACGICPNLGVKVVDAETEARIGQPAAIQRGPPGQRFQRRKCRPGKCHREGQDGGANGDQLVQGHVDQAALDALQAKKSRCLVHGQYFIFATLTHKVSLFQFY